MGFLVLHLTSYPSITYLVNSCTLFNDLRIRLQGYVNTNRVYDIYRINHNESRKKENKNVYHITASLSCFIYIYIYRPNSNV